MSFLRLTPAQLSRALELARQTEGVLRAQLEAAQKERDTLAARVAELSATSDNSRNAVLPPPPAIDALDYVAFEDDVRETLEFYAQGGQDSGNRAAKIINDARRRAEAMLNESETP